MPYPVSMPVADPPHPAKQAGVVLFIALIALVVMSLAAVALIRSVDTNTLIAGNISYKQSALVSSDSGVETALSWLTTQTDLNENLNTQGYYATSADEAKTLADSPNAKVATGNLLTDGVDSSGNTIKTSYNACVTTAVRLTRPTACMARPVKTKTPKVIATCPTPVWVNRLVHYCTALPPRSRGPKTLLATVRPLFIRICHETLPHPHHCD